MAAAKSNKTKNNKELSAIEKKLLECYKTYKPVLLYGTNNIEHRVELIKQFWIQKCGGVDAKEEYFQEDISMPPKNPTNVIELSEKYRSIHGNSNHKKMNKYIKSHARITDRTWRYLDAGCLSGKKVYKEVSKEMRFEIRVEEGAVEMALGGFANIEKYMNRKNRNIEDYQGTNPNKHRNDFFVCNGLMFLDNLHCDRPPSEDGDYYRKLSQTHLNLYKEDCIIKINDLYEYDCPFSFRWLVAFTHDTKPFPPYFLEQFELVSLDSKDYEVKEQEEKIVIEATKEIAASEGSHAEKVIVESNRERTKTKYTESKLYKKTPKDAKWQDLTMGFTGHLEDKVDITFKGEKKEIVSLKDLGFVKGTATKKFKPNVSLNLLKIFAKDKNVYSFPPKDKNERTKLHAQVKSLREKLKQCFRIGGDPVPANEKGGYRILFKAYCYDIEIKQEVDTYLVSLKEYFKELKTEVSNTRNYRDDDRIKEIKESIQACAIEITQRTPSLTTEDVICLECHQKIPIYNLASDNTQLLCEDCMPEPSQEYEASSVVKYKDNDIPRS